MLAVEGDVDAQRLLVGELLEDVRAGRTQPRDELDWMSTLRAPEFLEALFEILESVYPSGDEPRSGWDVRDVLTPTIEAIATIGTREAVRRYDSLLAPGDDHRWLRGRRDRIAAEVLRAQGGAASAVAAAAAGVPLFEPVHGPLMVADSIPIGLQVARPDLDAARGEQRCFYVKDDSVFAGFWGRREPAEFAGSGGVASVAEGSPRAAEGLRNASAGGGRVVISAFGCDSR